MVLLLTHLQVVHSKLIMLKKMEHKIKPKSHYIVLYQLAILVLIIVHLTYKYVQIVQFQVYTCQTK